MSPASWRQRPRGIPYRTVNLRDPATPDSFTPTVRRLMAGEFDEGPAYATYRRRGTTDWLLIHTLDGQGSFGSGIHAGPGITTLIRPGTLQDYSTAGDRWHFLFAHFHP